MDEIYSLVISHKRAPVEQIETLTRRSVEEQLETLQDAGAEEAFVLHTCNRAEYYVAGTPDPLEAILEPVDLSEDVISRYHSIEAVRHLMRVAGGLESMITGEDEILGQVSRAYEQAGPYLDGKLGLIVEKAVRVGKHIRAETGINEGHTSLGSAAATLGEMELDGFDGATVLVIGAGEMGQLIAHALEKRGAELLLSNRTYRSAEELAATLSATPVSFSAIRSRMEAVDLVVTATDSPHPILDAATFEGTSVVVLDMGNPRDVDPEAENLESVTIYTIDDVGERVENGLDGRAKATEAAESIIEEELDRLTDELKRERAEKMLSTIYRKAERLRRSEVERAEERLRAHGNLSEAEAEVLEDLSAALVNKLLSQPTESIKEAAVSEDYETLEAVARVFEVSADRTDEREA